MSWYVSGNLESTLLEQFCCPNGVFDKGMLQRTHDSRRPQALAEAAPIAYREKCGNPGGRDDIE